MADISDVETALQGLVYGAAYPNGAPPSALNVPVKIYPGWPDPDTLEADLKPTGAGSPPSGPPSALHVSIYPRPGDRDTTRYRFEDEELTLPAATWTLTVANTFTLDQSLLGGPDLLGPGPFVEVGGSAPNPYAAQNLAVFCNGLGFVYQAQANDTASTIATALAALINASLPGTTTNGAVICLPAGTRIGALRVGVFGTSIREVGRQEKDFQVTVWADSPANRSALSKLFDPVLRNTARLTLADGTVAHLRHKGTMDNDFDQKQGIYRRDHVFCVEWATVLVTTAAEIVEQIVALDDPNGNLITTTYS